MILVHRDGAKSPLPEMAGSFPSRVDHAGVGPMRPRERPTQAVLVAPERG